MMILFLSVGILLGIALGRNNLSNLFGSAIGMRMLSVKTAVFLSVVCVFAGAFMSSDGTTNGILKLAPLETLIDAFVICLSALVVLQLLTWRGVPASIAQTVVGALIGWNLFHHLDMDSYRLKQVILAWCYSPFLAMFLAYFLMNAIRRWVRYHPIPLFQRDWMIRMGLVFVGSYAAYALGANNISTIVGPYLKILPKADLFLTFATCLAVSVGFMFADQKVIRTMTSGLFPMTPSEALIVGFVSATTMMLFSWEGLRHVLIRLEWPYFPLVPLPLSNTMTGAIIGIALTKGGYGLKPLVLGRVLASWFIVPVASGLICWMFLFILKAYGRIFI